MTNAEHLPGARVVVRVLAGCKADHLPGTTGTVLSRHPRDQLFAVVCVQLDGESLDFFALEDLEVLPRSP